MAFSKIIATLLIAATMSPLCCCYGDILLPEEEDPHACCSLPQEEDKDSDKSGHNEQDCPHRGGKVFKEANPENLKGEQQLFLSSARIETFFTWSAVSKKSQSLPGIVEQTIFSGVFSKRYQVNCNYLL